MIKEHKVSIVVAIYNSEKFLDKLINSLINQTYSNLEIILVDDGSPDKSGEICDKYAKLDERIIVVHKKNGGTCDARNRGIELATGEYLMIVDGDDWLSLDCVEYLLGIAIDTESDMAFSDKIFTTRDQIQNQDDQIEIWTSEEATAKIIYPHMEIGPWNKIYKLDMIRKNNISFSVPWSGEGLYFASMAAQCSNHVGVGHRKVYNYRLNNSASGLTKFNVLMGINALSNIKYIGDHLIINTDRIKKAVNWHIWKNYNFLLMLIIATQKYKEYKKEYKECLKNIRLMFPKVFIESEIRFNYKIKMIFSFLFPRCSAKRKIKKNRKSLLNDNME